MESKASMPLSSLVGKGTPITGKVVQEVETGDHVWFIGEVQAAQVNQGYEWKDGLLFKWVGKDGFYYNVGEQTGIY